MVLARVECVRAYRFRIYPSKAQAAAMRHHLWISKELWNSLLEQVKRAYAETSNFLAKSQLQSLAKKTGLHSQVAQAVAHRLHRALKRFTGMKKNGKHVGFPRFKGLDRVKSLLYPQSGFQLKKKLKVTPFGEICIKKHREINGIVKTLTLKRESSGKWFAIFAVEQALKAFEPNYGECVGVDLGLTSFAALSNGTTIANPRFYQKEEFKLSQLQRELSKRKKDGRNRNKSKLRVARLLEHVANARNDFLHKQSRILVEKYRLIALEDLQTQKMAERRFGKFILDASWGKFASMVRYKAESAGCEVVFVDPSGTTKQCSACGKEQEMPLSQRIYSCSSCDLLLDRDMNAALNILAKATVGTTESHAWGDETVFSPLSQEAQGSTAGSSQD